LVIDGAFDSAAGAAIFHAATGLDATIIATAQQCARRQLW